MDLSSKMPAQQDAQQSAKMPAMRESSAPAVGGGEGSSMDPISQNTAAQPTSIEASGKGTQGWETQERKEAMGWETADRKN